MAKQLDCRATVRRQNEQKNKENADKLCNLLLDNLQRAVDLAMETGAFTWLTSSPLIEHRFALQKSAFHDALALRYGWTPTKMASKCDCGNNFLVKHALSCSKRGFPSMRHNEMCNLTVVVCRVNEGRKCIPLEAREEGVFSSLPCFCRFFYKSSPILKRTFFKKLFPLVYY